VKSLQDQFIDWICQAYAPVWDDLLVDLMDDGDVQTNFLIDMGLPLDTEIEP
jgi:hypothetical protein